MKNLFGILIFILLVLFFAGRFDNATVKKKESKYEKVYGKFWLANGSGKKQFLYTVIRQSKGSCVLKDFKTGHQQIKSCSFLKDWRNNPNNVECPPPYFSKKAIKHLEKTWGRPHTKEELKEFGYRRKNGNLVIYGCGV